VFIAALVAALCLVPLPFSRLIGFFLAAGVLPGIAMAARSRFRLSECIGIGTALSPSVFGVCVVVAMWFGAPVPAAAWVAVATSCVLFVALARGATDDDAGERRVLAGVFVLVLIAAVMCFALPLAHLWWRARDDSWFHAAVTEKLLRNGLPVTDPYFAGLRLQYMYFYHALLAACVSLTGVDALHAMIVVNAIALVSCASAFNALAGLFSRRAGPRVAATVLWLFGMNGWFYFFYVIRLARAFTGDTHGAATLRQFFPWTPTGHATAMSLISVEGNQFMFLEKFMLGTALSLTFSLAASMLFLLLSARRGAWSIRHDAALFLCAAGTMLLHPFTGITLAAVTAAVLVLLLIVRSQTARGGPSYARLLGALVAGAAVTLPYVRTVAPASGSGASMAAVSFQPWFAIGLIADILPALALTLWFFRRAADHTDTPEVFGARPVDSLTLSGSGLLGVWFIFMLLVALTVDLPVNNETKFSFFLWLPLCVLSAGCFERVWDWRSRRYAALLVLLSATLPLHALYYHHAVRDHSTLAISDDERTAYQWIEKNTPRDAVFIEAGDRVRVPVLANRDDYWGIEAYARNWGYSIHEMAARRDVRDHAFSIEGLSGADVARLQVLGRPVFVIATDGNHNDAHLRRRFAGAHITIFEVTE
jgi:hypothetical protein